MRMYVHRKKGEMRRLPRHYRLVHAVAFENERDLDRNFIHLNMGKEVFSLEECNCDRLSWRERWAWWWDDFKFVWFHRKLVD